MAKSNQDLRLRLIAGPNGSGKSTLFKRLINKINIGVWINADEILSQLQSKGFIEYSSLNIFPTNNKWRSFIKLSGFQQFIKTFVLEKELSLVQVGDFTLSAGNKEVTNGLAAFIADFFRYFLLSQSVRFTTESVFSHPSKLELIKSAQKKGYKTYLYFIATSNPLLNIVRIKGRIAKGGHSVTDETVTARYYRSIELAAKCLNLFHRVFIFDNSSLEIKLLAGYEHGELVFLTNEPLPDWSKQIINI